MWIEVYDPTRPMRDDCGFASYTIDQGDAEWLQRSLAMLVGMYPDRWAAACVSTAISARRVFCDNRFDSIHPFAPLQLERWLTVISPAETT